MQVKGMRTEGMSMIVQQHDAFYVYVSPYNLFEIFVISFLLCKKIYIFQTIITTANDNGTERCRTRKGVKQTNEGGKRDEISVVTDKNDLILTCKWNEFLL